MSGVLSSYRWIMFLAGGLLLVGLVSALVYESDRDNSGPVLRTSSSGPYGARALMIWLADLGYEPSTLAFRQFSIDPDTRVLFVLQPTHVFAGSDIGEILGWVEGGGVLVVASESPNALLDAYGVSVVRQNLGQQTPSPLQPVLVNPPVQTTQVWGSAWLELNDPGWTPLLRAEGERFLPLMAARDVGAGTVFALSDPYLFSNGGIGAEDNGALILNMLAGVPPGSEIAFDEYHQGLTEHGTLSARLSREPWGWAIIYVTVVTLLYLAVSGRRFGRATQPAPIAALRSRAEYVATMGAMLRRGNHHDWLRRQYAVQVKRALGSRYRVRADQPAREFMAAIGDRSGDFVELGPLLERLETPQPLGERETIELMREVETIQNRMTGR
jgi:hypothetical protein